MKKILSLVIICFLVVGIAVSGCGQKKAASSKEAINAAKAMESVDAQAKYLEGQANAFLKAKEYKDALNTAQYLLRNVDGESSKAREIIEDAKKEMQAAVKEKLAGLKK